MGNGILFHIFEAFVDSNDRKRENAAALHQRSERKGPSKESGLSLCQSERFQKTELK